MEGAEDDCDGSKSMLLAHSIRPDWTCYVRSTQGVTLAVHVFERRSHRLQNSANDTIALFHCNGFHSMAYHELIVDLLDEFRCLAADLRGHGMSTTPIDLAYSWYDFAEDVIQVVERMQIRGCFAFGHSLGAASCLLACLKSPKLFAKMYLFEPPVFPPIEKERIVKSNELSSAARRRRAAFHTKVGALDSFSKKPQFRTMTRGALLAYVDYGLAETVHDGEITYELKCKPEHEAIIYEEGAKADIFEQLRLINVPVTLATGNPGIRGPGQYGEDVVRELPLGQLQVFPKLTHFGPLEDHRVVAESILQSFRTSRNHALSPKL